MLDGYLLQRRQTSKCANNRSTQFPSSSLRLYQALAGGDAHQLHRPAHTSSVVPRMACPSGPQDMIHLTILEELADCFHYAGREVGTNPYHGPDALRTIVPTQRRHLRVE
jgi:hypothetical protein